MDVSFYQVKGITPADVDAVLPKLVEKIIDRGLHAQIVCPSAERLERLDELLWGFEEDAFLPHCRFDDEEAALEPVVLALAAESVNNAEVLVLINGQMPPAEALEGYQRVLDVFDAGDVSTKAARSRWKLWKEQGATLSYFAHEEGKWVKKA